MLVDGSILTLNPGQIYKIRCHLRCWVISVAQLRIAGGSRPGASGEKERMSRPIRRVLSPSAVASRRVAVIHLRVPLPTPSSGLPGYLGEQPSNVSCLTLLLVGFTEPHRSPGTLVVSYTTVSPLLRRTEIHRSGLFSVALSRGSPRVGVTHHHAL